MCPGLSGFLEHSYVVWRSTRGLTWNLESNRNLSLPRRLSPNYLAIFKGRDALFPILLGEVPWTKEQVEDGVLSRVHHLALSYLTSLRLSFLICEMGIIISMHQVLLPRSSIRIRKDVLFESTVMIQMVYKHTVLLIGKQFKKTWDTGKKFKG